MESMNKKPSYFNSKRVKKLALGFMKNEISMEEIEKMDMPQDARDALMLNIEAYQYLIKYEEDGNKYVTERLRTAYIGEEMSDTNGVTYLSTVRGKPTGTIVAIPDGEKILIGVAKLDEDEKYPSAIVGLYLALKNAKYYEDNETPVGLNGHERRQLTRFRLRAKAYFFPDKYSYSRGSEPVVYPKYEEIHKRQIMILGEEKVKSMACQPPAKDAKNRGRKVTLFN